MNKLELLLVEAALNGWIMENNGRIQLTQAGQRMLREQNRGPVGELIDIYNHPLTQQGSDPFTDFFKWIADLISEMEHETIPDMLSASEDAGKVNRRVGRVPFMGKQ